MFLALMVHFLGFDCSSIEFWKFSSRLSGSRGHRSWRLRRTSFTSETYIAIELFTSHHPPPRIQRCLDFKPPKWHRVYSHIIRGSNTCAEHVVPVSSDNSTPHLASTPSNPYLNDSRPRYLVRKELNQKRRSERRLSRRQLLKQRREGQLE
jgi:hypothetical protein